MVALLLAIIYLAFVSLGLPDSLLGSCWPVVHDVIDVPTSFMGIVTMIIAGCTIISSLFSDKLIKKFNTGFVIGFSTLLTAIAMFLFSIANSFYQFCLIAIPYGLGAGAVDSALNNYVALHFKAKHMSFLHGMWGLGAVISPNIMSYALIYRNSYQDGYRIVFIIQLLLTIILFSAIPLFKRNNTKNENDDIKDIKLLTFKEKFKIEGIWFVLIGFLAYCAYEATAMQWTTTYLVNAKNIDSGIGAAFGSLFYIGITISRILTGLIVTKFGYKKLMRVGALIVLAATLSIIFINNIYVCLISIAMIGFGAGPIYPGIMHSTPIYFGKNSSLAVIGLEMAFAYTGTTFVPPLYGVLASAFSYEIYPYFVLFFLVLMFVMIEILNKKAKKRELTNLKYEN